MSMRRPVVRVVPLQPHCFAFGGFEVQMIAAMQSAQSAGADVAPLDFWNREADFDILHFWGLELQHSYTIRWAHAAGKRIVLSALVNYPGWSSRFRHLVSSVIGPARLRQPMLRMIDCITVVNEAQARYLVSVVGVSAHKVTVVPNSVEDVFFGVRCSAKNALSSREYVACVGNVCRRKNQLTLVNACRSVGVPVVLVGNVLTGEDDYGGAVEAAINDVRGSCWIRGLSSGSAELAKVYQDAAAFALPSYLEQQPISALEAAASGKPLVLADRPYARQEFYENAALANPHSVSSVAAAIRKVLSSPDRYRPSICAIEKCRKEKVGSAYFKIYRRLFTAGTGKGSPSNEFDQS